MLGGLIVKGKNMPKWRVPECYENFRIPDYKKKSLDKLPANILRMERNAIQDKLESIQDLTYYQRDSVIPGERVTWGNRNDRQASNRIWLDSGECYALLYYIDTLLERLKQ